MTSRIEDGEARVQRRLAWWAIGMYLASPIVSVVVAFIVMITFPCQEMGCLANLLGGIVIGVMIGGAMSIPATITGFILAIRFNRNGIDVSRRLAIAALIITALCALSLVGTVGYLLSFRSIFGF